MNLFLLLGAMGLSHSLFGARLLPIGTLYDPFIARGLDALNYACYQDARFILVATPSGVALAPEGGAHQSIGSPLIGMAQPGLISYEPAYADELAVILRWAFEHIQAEGDEGGSVYLRLSTRVLDQLGRTLTPDLTRDIIAGGYWLSPPGPSTRVVLAYQGTVSAEAITAAGLMSEDRHGVGVLAITSADRLYSEWRRGQRHHADGRLAPPSHVEKLLVADSARRGDRDHHRRPSGDVELARRRRWASRRKVSASTNSARPERSPISIVISVSMRKASCASSRPPRRAVRSGSGLGDVGPTGQAWEPTCKCG